MLAQQRPGACRMCLQQPWTPQPGKGLRSKHRGKIYSRCFLRLTLQSILRNVDDRGTVHSSCRSSRDGSDGGLSVSWIDNEDRNETSHDRLGDDETRNLQFWAHSKRLDAIWQLEHPTRPSGPHISTADTTTEHSEARALGDVHNGRGASTSASDTATVPDEQLQRLRYQLPSQDGRPGPDARPGAGQPAPSPRSQLREGATSHPLPLGALSLGSLTQGRKHQEGSGAAHTGTAEVDADGAAQGVSEWRSAGGSATVGGPVRDEGGALTSGAGASLPDGLSNGNGKAEARAVGAENGTHVAEPQVPRDGGTHRSGRAQVHSHNDRGASNSHSGEGASSSHSGAAASSTTQHEGAADVEEVNGDAAPTGIPRSIFVISFISMALTSASCVFNTLLPIYMVTELNMSMRSMGIFEGVLEAFSYVVRMFSGVISDRLRSRKTAILLGFSMSACAKFSMCGATTLGRIFMGKAMDKLANGVQAAPRDALIGDLSPPACRSACYGLAQSLRKWGSAAGALGAFFLMKASNENYRLIFVIASMVSAASCVAFAAFVPAHTKPQRHKQAHSDGALTGEAAGSGGEAVGARVARGGRRLVGALLHSVRDMGKMGAPFYRMLAIIGLYALGNINEAMIELRAIEVGFARTDATLVIALLCFVVFLCAYPLGRFTDKHGHRPLLALGMGSLIAGDAILLLHHQSQAAVVAACLFLGVHWAVLQGAVLSAVVKLSPPHLRGTAFGVYYTVMAAVAMCANSVCGHLWHALGAPAAFGFSAATAAATLALMPWLLPSTGGRWRQPAAVAGKPAAVSAAA